MIGSSRSVELQAQANLKNVEKGVLGQTDGADWILSGYNLERCNSKTI